MTTTGTFFTHLDCSKCCQKHSKNEIHNLSTCCSLPLFPTYDLDRAKSGFRKQELLNRPPTMWRYKEMMPVESDENIVTLGEGFTPLQNTKTLGNYFGLNHLFLKN